MVFVDLIGSTAMAEVLPPGEVVATLNDFFDVVVRTVDGQGGWVNKFEGDGAQLEAIGSTESSRRSWVPDLQPMTSAFGRRNPFPPEQPARGCPDEVSPRRR